MNSLLINFCELKGFFRRKPLHVLGYSLDPEVDEFVSLPRYEEREDFNAEFLRELNFSADEGRELSKRSHGNEVLRLLNPVARVSNAVF